MTDRSATTDGIFPGRGHDHHACVADALAEAATVCARRSARFTALRRRVLEIIWESHKPLGAYPILERLTLDGRRAAPPTVYRALDFLLEHGLVHRIDSLNAFVGCARPGHAGKCQFLICRGCGTAAELNDASLALAIDRTAETEGFAAESHTIEITGLCPECR